MPLRRVAPLLLALVAGCASPGVPPGGPEDEDVPVIVQLRPDTNAVNVKAGSLSLDFDEVISERAQGAPRLAELFMISPSKGPTELEWHRTRLVVRPRGGFKPNTTYRVQMLPGLTDLDNNVDSVGRTFVFSTGPSIATGAIRGRVFEWMEARVAKEAFVEALVLPDSTHWITRADSMGLFTLANMPPGTYLLRAIADANKNRVLDVRELYDTVTVVLKDSLRREMLALVRDTLGAGIERVEVEDSLTIRVRFDRAIDTAQVVLPSMFTVKTKEKDRDSATVAVASVIGARVMKQMRDDSLKAKAIQDSIRRANDTTATADSSKRDSARVAAARDSAARAAAAARARTQTAAQRAIAAARARLAGGREAPVDTTPPPKPSVRLPEIEVYLRMAQPLPPNTPFRVRAEGVRTILGRTRSSERTQATPKPKADSTKAPTRPGRTPTRPAARDTGTVRRDTTGVRRPAPPPRPDTLAR